MTPEHSPAPAAIRFRPATSADTDALVALVESAYRGDVSKQGWTTEADMLGGRRTGPDDIQDCLARAGSRILLAERDTPDGTPELLACAHVAVEDGAGYFGMFSVRPDLQGGGLGKVLLAEAERVAREEWGLPLMRMTVIDIRDELIAFYRSEEHTSELQSQSNLVCRLLLEKKKIKNKKIFIIKYYPFYYLFYNYFIHPIVSQSIIATMIIKIKIIISKYLTQ